MSREPQHGRRRGGPRARRRVHAGGGGDVVGQEGGRHGSLRVEIGHPGGGHRHVVVVIEAGRVLRGEAGGGRALVVRVHIGGDRGHAGRRGAVLVRVPQTEELLDRERRPLHWKDWV